MTTTFKLASRRRFAAYLENVQLLKEKVTHANEAISTAQQRCGNAGQQILELINELANLPEPLLSFLEDPTSPPEEEDETELLRDLKTKVDNLVGRVRFLTDWYNRYIDAYGNLMDVEDDYLVEKRKMDKARQENEDYLSERVI